MLKQLDVLIGFATIMTLVSLLITIINQMIVSGLQLRGRSLLDALEVMFKTIKPGLGDKARALAEAVLKHPIISDSARSGAKRALATAIRPQELIDVLEKVGQATGLQDCPWIGHQSFKLGAKPAGGAPGDITIGDLAGVAGELAAALKQPEQALAPVNEVITEITAALPAGFVNRDAILNKVKTLETSAVSSAETSVRAAEKWLSTVEDRSREWFATRAQQGNVIIAIVLAFVLQLDAIALYRSLQNDAFRAATVATAGVVQKKAEELLVKTDQPADPAKAQEALKKSQKEMQDLLDASKSLQTGATGFQLIPDPYFPGVGATTPAQKLMLFFGFGTISTPALPGLPAQSIFGLTHFCGMAIFAALLSMGAPYWFNLLKTLTGFRPALAQRVDKEKEQATGVKA